MAEDRIGGGGMTLTLATAPVYVKKLTPKANPKLVDVTDTSAWDPSTGLIYTQELPVALQTEFGIEGVFYKSSTPTHFISKLFSGTGGPHAVVATLNGTVSLFSGYYNVSDFSITSVVDDAINFTANLKSSGKVTAT